MACENSALYLGFDFSTQQIKVLAVDDDLKVVYENNIKFDDDLPKYKTNGGVHIASDGVTVTSPTLMWVEALDCLLDKLKLDSFPFERVVSLSGSGQQHGSVYWKKGTQHLLHSLNNDKSMADQLQDAFAVPNSPVWMDASTTAYCRKLEAAVGGAKKLAEITGARAYERLTAVQIAKIFQEQPLAYTNTERISLVSSFAASLFVGDYAPIDFSDGAGMNLLDISTRDWADVCLQNCAPDLREKLGVPVPSTQIVGTVSSYLCQRYGFAQCCSVVAFVGDNPASLAGLAPQDGDIVVSLGTSDTVFLWLETPRPQLEGNIFVNPVVTTDFMALLCFKNGSLTRERIRNDRSKGSWDIFDKQLEATAMGNNDNIGIYFDVTEIQPLVKGIYRFDENNQQVEDFPDEVEVRAVIEGQCMSRRVHSEYLGFNIGQNTRVIATGGASSNKGILQVMADVFNAPVYVTDVKNSAALGCAYRAKHAGLGAKASFAEVVAKCPKPVCAALPTPGSDEVYDALSQRYLCLEQMLIKKYGQP